MPVVVRQRDRRVRAAVPRLGSVLAFGGIIVACGGGSPPAKNVTEQPATTTTANVSEKCPDLSKADEVAAFDFGREYALSSDAAEKLKAAVLAAMEVGALAERLDADFGIACAQIARDLGNKGDWRSGNDACAAAVKAVQSARGRLGPKAQTKLVVRTPVCLADASLVTKCASLCDSSVPAGKARAECEQKAGRCDGNCDGLCEPKGNIKCDGACSGSCEGPIKGTCGGRCKGTCDGRPVNGGCLGECKGTCTGAMSGECKGKCGGACKLAKPGICDGICSGACTVELSEAKCAGDFTQPEVSADCVARCELAVLNKTECSAPHASLAVVGAKDREAAESMKTAIDKSFPALLKILQEIGDKAPKKVDSAKAVVENARKSLKEMARSGGKATAASSEAQLVKCFDETFKRAVAAGLSAKTGIDQAESVRSEASK